MPPERPVQVQGRTSRFRLWACPEGHAFQARDDEDPDVWRPACKRCVPEKPGVSRPLMDLIEVEQCS